MWLEYIQQPHPTEEIETADISIHSVGMHRRTKDGKYWEGICKEETCRRSSGLKTQPEADAWARDHMKQMRNARTDGRGMIKADGHVIIWMRTVRGRTYVFNLELPIDGFPLHIKAWDYTDDPKNPKRVR